MESKLEQQDTARLRSAINLFISTKSHPVRPRTFGMLKLLAILSVLCALAQSEKVSSNSVKVGTHASSPVRQRELPPVKVRAAGSFWEACVSTLTQRMKLRL